MSQSASNLYHSQSEFVARLREYHERSGLSLREVAQMCDLDFTYVQLILQGKRRPHRDVIVLLCGYAWQISQPETDDVLMLGNYPPLGRSANREYRQRVNAPSKTALDAQGNSNVDNGSVGRAASSPASLGG
jgi:transcriptional regulator with XRE-family HTH domain